MQTRELDGPDLIIRVTWAERMALSVQAEQIQRNIEASFEKHFGKPKASNGMTRREEPGQD